MCLRLVVRVVDACCGLVVCTSGCFVCDTAVGNVVCCDGGCVCACAGVCRCACAMFMWRVLLYVCVRAVHVRRCIGRVVGDCGGAGRACDCIVRVLHVDDGRS